MPRPVSFDFAILDVVLERPMQQLFPITDKTAEPVPMSIKDRLEALKLVFDECGQSRGVSAA